jgi:hypothetical protein
MTAPTGPVDPANPTKIIVISPNAGWMHAYRTVQELLDDPNRSVLSKVDFFTAAGHRLWPVPDAPAPVTGLRYDGMPANPVAVQERTDKVIEEVRKKPNADSSEAKLLLDQLLGANLDGRFELLMSQPGHLVAAAGASGERTHDGSTVASGIHTDHVRGWLHNLICH